MSYLPLKGVKVLDLSLLLPGPLCSMYLADLGAEVIKVENPRAADGTRYMFKSESGVPGLYLMLNRNKKAITLNLKKKESIGIIHKLLEDSDILLEGFRPGAMDEMGLGYDELSKKFPKLIYCGISGYGREGVHKDYAGHDGNYLALSGILELSGSIDSPNLPGFQLADIGGGSLTALSGILAALYGREKTGKGVCVDVSMMESSLQFLSLYIGIYASTGKNPQRGNELLSGKLPNYSVYKIKDNRFVLLGALEERFFRSFLRAISKEKLLESIPLLEENFSNWKKLLEDYFLDKSIVDLEPLFTNSDACLTLIRTLEEVIKDPELQRKGLVFYKDHPEYGSLLQLGSPFSYIRKNEYRSHPPKHGEHTNEVLQALGYTAEELQGLKQKRII
jgi:crotonobetainyl-CoA:carnitine CoA-transferase CaiB-like acyl-CoA transferase